MQETDRHDLPDSNPAWPRINYPEVGLDLRFILYALRFEIPYRKIVYGPSEKFGVHVVIPSVRHRFVTKPIGNYLLIRSGKKVKVPIEVDEQGALSERLIIVIANHLTKTRVNSPTHLLKL